MTTCAICLRDLGDVLIESHHLIPKTFKGKETIDIHKICHNKIHATWTERELLQFYHTPERIRSDPQIIKFIKWIKNKDSSFYDKNDDTKDRKRKRR